LNIFCFNLFFNFYHNKKNSHKPLFPLDQREITGLITILILVGFAQAGGIG
jgi:hypothetical protein